MCKIIPLCCIVTLFFGACAAPFFVATGVTPDEAGIARSVGIISGSPEISFVEVNGEDTRNGAGRISDSSGPVEVFTRAGTVVLSVQYQRQRSDSFPLDPSALLRSRHMIKFIGEPGDRFIVYGRPEGNLHHIWMVNADTNEIVSAVTE